MAIDSKYVADVEKILSHRYDNGADYWATPDNRIMKGSPFTTLNSILMLLELGMEPSEPVLQGAAELIFQSWRDDGRFRIAPKGAIYPCQTINCANALCHLGYATDSRLIKTFNHLLEIQHTDGGWRCNKNSFGSVQGIEYSNPGPTLTALDNFRYAKHLNSEPALNKAVDFLLEHWIIRKPIGPCQFGIGTLFMQPEYPFISYNLFVYVYVLSFYDRAKEDKRFLEAVDMLKSMVVDGNVIVKRTNPKLSKFSFCKKGQPSELATMRYNEIIANLERK